jgi:hypothetical protein
VRTRFTKVERAYKAWLCMNGHDDVLTNTELALITEYVKWSEPNTDDGYPCYVVNLNRNIRKAIMQQLEISSDTLTLYTRKLAKHCVLQRNGDKQLRINVTYVNKELHMIMQESRTQDTPYFVTYAFCV